MTQSAPTQIALSRLELDVLWEHLDLGAYPTVYRMIGHGETYEERLVLVDQAWASLAAKGLGERTAVNPVLTEFLTVLARPDRAVDARFSHGEQEVRALAGARGESGVLSVVDGDQVTCTEVTPGGLSRAMVGLLPEHPAGRGSSVNLPSAVFSAACAESGNTQQGLRNALIGRGVRGEDAQLLVDALDETVGGGQFGAAIRDRLDRRRRGSYVIGFVDSAAGRFLLTARKSGGGESWTTVSPTDPLRLTGQIDRLLGELDREFSD